MTEALVLTAMLAVQGLIPWQLWRWSIRPPPRAPKVLDWGSTSPSDHGGFF